MKIETKALHEGYSPKNGEPHILPIWQSTTFRYNSTEQIGRLFDFEDEGHLYSRISNPTVAAVEAKIASLEGGVGAVLTCSGQMATFLALSNIVSTGDHVICAATVYGGTANLLLYTLKRFGVEATFINEHAGGEELAKAFRPNTKALFGETISNPSVDVLDIEKFARLAHSHGVPLVVDNTFATPALCRPFEYGADIITHSTTKYMDGQATVIGGAVVDSGNFDWSGKKWACLNEPDPSYHGIVYTEKYGRSAYTAKARAQMVRDLGVCPPALDAWLLDHGIATLALRMERHSSNALAVARHFERHDKVISVRYPGLESHPQHELAKKYLPKGASGVIAVEIAGGRSAAARLLDNLKLASQAVHVADIRTLALHPASSTHRQLPDDMLASAGVTPGLVRFSCGCENIEDILEDIENALKFV